MPAEVVSAPLDSGSLADLHQGNDAADTDAIPAEDGEEAFSDAALLDSSDSDATGDDSFDTEEEDSAEPDVLPADVPTPVTDTCVDPIVPKAPPSDIDFLPEDCTPGMDGQACMPACNSHGTCSGGTCKADGVAIVGFQSYVSGSTKQRLPIIRMAPNGDFLISGWLDGLPMDPYSGTWLKRVSPSGKVVTQSWFKPEGVHQLYSPLDRLVFMSGSKIQRWTVDGLLCGSTDLGFSYQAKPKNYWADAAYHVAALQDGYVATDGVKPVAYRFDGAGNLTATVQLSSDTQDEPLYAVDRPGGGFYLQTKDDLRAVDGMGKVLWTLQGQGKIVRVLPDGLVTRGGELYGLVWRDGDGKATKVWECPGAFAPLSDSPGTALAGLDAISGSVLIGVMTSSCTWLWQRKIKLDIAKTQFFTEEEDAPGWPGYWPAQSRLRLPDGGFVFALVAPDPLFMGAAVSWNAWLVRTDARGRTNCP